MTHQAIQGLALIILTVFIHAVGSAFFIWALRKYHFFWVRHWGFTVNVLSLSWVVGTLVALHLTEIIAWAGFYYVRGVFDTLESPSIFPSSPTPRWDTATLYCPSSGGCWAAARPWSAS